MATDATGAPTSKGIPKYNTSVDAPSGLGFNAAMDAIDALLDDYVQTPAGIATGEGLVWNGTAWVRSSATKLNISSLEDPGSDKVIGSSGGAAAAIIPAGTIMAEQIVTTEPGTTGVTVTTSGGDALGTFPSATYPVGRYYLDLVVQGLQTNGSGARLYFGAYRNDGTTALTGWLAMHSTTAGVQHGPFFIRGYFDLASEITETLKIRWGGDGSGATYTITKNGGAAYVWLAQIVRG